TLSYNTLQYDSVSLAICNGDSVIVNGNVYYLAGNYSDTIPVAGGCKKIQVTQLSLLSKSDSIQATVCQGDSVLIGQHAYTVPGIYYDSLSTFTGCDSVVIITLSYSVLPIDSTTLTLCNGDSVLIGNHVYTTAGIYSDTIPVSIGCKKIQVTQLMVYSSIVDNVSASFCAGDSFTMGSIIYHQPGIYIDTLSSVYGCDSVVILQLDRSFGGTSNTTATICNGENFIFGNHVYTQGGTFEEIIPAAGCDSTATLQLTVEPIPSASILVSNNNVVSGTVIQLNCSNSQLLSYSWSGNTSFTNPHAPYTESIITTSTWISLSVTGNNGCSNIDSVYIFIPEEEDSCAGAALYIPNTFTPNFDGVNDFFSVVTTNIKVDLLKVYNRWGQEVFAAEDASRKWDGRFRDKRCADGVYYYLIQYNSCVDGRKRTRHGSITLLN
ncbi:MAG: gliding motility-associated C-terminal domain-containing protein, partial [Bacteroidota bacterium]